MPGTDMIGLSQFAVISLAVWRIAHLLAHEDGPWDLVVWLRRAAGSGFWGGLLDCFYCLSLWVALPFAIGFGTDWPERLVLWPALSGAAILMQRATTPVAAPRVGHIFDQRLQQEDEL